ncbi:hypothetical protein [Neptunitalea lumnitzerae]|uniref:DUF3887 domain-containing protein n=1 Tax=Neptunitalea lumnitzerae TaxID=2965509 RepID=A0ABQ5MEM6_9FLAO|nr:hypothetical protein [Neptunitalea sp. Y10]GLB47811.1 hypothetical protein Y10_01790 [Neptunitalea sp. Y10]
MKKILLILCLLSTAYISTAQTSPEELTKVFFEKYKKSPSEALDYLFGTNPYMTKNKDAVTNLKEQLQQSIPLFGKYVGYEKLKEKNIGTFFKTYTYAAKYQRQPLRFIFQYYKAENKWVLFNFKFDDQITKELD